MYASGELRPSVRPPVRMQGCRRGDRPAGPAGIARRDRPRRHERNQWHEWHDGSDRTDRAHGTVRSAGSTRTAGATGCNRTTRANGLRRCELRDIPRNHVARHRQSGGHRVARHGNIFESPNLQLLHRDELARSMGVRAVHVRNGRAVLRTICPRRWARGNPAAQLDREFLLLRRGDVEMSYEYRDRRTVFRKLSTSTSPAFANWRYTVERCG
jgi:hypothetical protein